MRFALHALRMGSEEGQLPLPVSPRAVLSARVWVGAGVIAALAIAVGVPGLVRAAPFLRNAGHRFVAHGAANAPRFRPASRLDPATGARTGAVAGPTGLTVSMPRSSGARIDSALMHPLDPDLLSELSAESERAFRATFVEDPATGRIRLTRTGRTAYGTRFARAGIDIDQVRTRAALRAACIRSEWVVYEEIRTLVKGHKALEEILEPLWSRP